MVRRRLLPGHWNAYGRAVPDTRLEMDCDVAPDADRAIAPPRAMDSLVMRAMALYGACFVLAILGAALALWPR